MCKRIFKEQTSEEGEVPFYKIGTFGGIPDAFISRKLFDEYKTKYPYPNKGDILISVSGSIGRTVEFTGKDEYFQDSNIVWLKHGDEIDNSFLKVLYSVVEWSCEGSTIKRLYNDNFLKTNFMLPKIDEQIKLGAFFSSLDNLITLHQCKFLWGSFRIMQYLGNSVSSLRLPSRQVKRIKITFLMKAIRLQTRRVSFHRMRNLRTVEQCEMLTKECIILSLHNPSRTILRE